ncbi:hypothetical protein BKA64DRAFT_704665 [Cadophora sp. MPI-SDFR-AT-0126]|nr:hypothetical protein BKA64DRAFT_704665 [Leotiomycetes sp. MPI-SDFR-AT-0126]
MSSASTRWESDSDIKKKHWALVFTPAFNFEVTKRPAFRLDLLPCTDKKPRYVATHIDERLERHHIGYWTGCFHDVKEIMDEHAVRLGSYDYSPCFNNCQHWAATMLVLLDDQAGARSGRFFEVSNSGMHKKVESALSTSGDFLHHKANPFFRGAAATGFAVTGGVAGALGVTATASVATTATVTIPAAGIAGFFGATVTETIFLGTTAAAGPVVACLACVAAPLLGGAAIFGGIVLAAEMAEWNAKTKFKDTRRASLRFLL